MGAALPKISADYGFGFVDMILLDGRPLRSAYPGQIFWVDSNASHTGRGTFKAPDITADAAYGRCVADRGDLVVIKPGHAETSGAAGSSTWLTMDVDGAGVVGLGGIGHQSGLMPTITMGTDTGSHIIVTGDDNLLAGINIVPAVADIDGLIQLDGSGFTMASCRCVSAASMGVEEFITLGSGYGRLTLLDNFIDMTADVSERFLFAEGTNAGLISKRNFIVGSFSVGVYDLDASSYTGMCLHEGDIMANLDTDPGMCVLIAAADTHIFKDGAYAGTKANTEPVDDISASFMFNTTMTDVAGTAGIIHASVTVWT